MQEVYEISEGILHIRDPELAISIQEPFSLPTLPKDLTIPFYDQKRQPVLEKNQEGLLEKAFFREEGKMHGECRLFYEGGGKKAEMYYKGGVLHGPSLFFSKDGTCLSSSWFYEGYANGKVKQYYLSGTLYSLQRYVKGKRVGKQEYYYEDGTLKSLMHYEEDQLHGHVQLFWPDGKIKRESFFVKGKRDGFDKIWDEKGDLIDEGEYRLGSAIGIHKRKYTTGVLKEELVFHDPTRFDKREWDRDGKLIYEGIYRSDLTYIEKVWDEVKKTMQEREGYWDGKKLCWKE